MAIGCLQVVFPRGYRNELKTVLRMALPLIVTQGCQCLTGFISLMFTGRLSKTEYDGAVLGISLIGALGTAISMGLATACDTLFSQVYTSSYKRGLGVVLARSIILITACAVLPLSVFINAESIFLSLNQHPEVSRLAANYLLIFSPGMLGYFLYMPLSKYLQSQDMMIPIMIIGLLANVINIIGNLLLVVEAGYGLTGSAVALALCYLSYPILTGSYIAYSKVYKETWTGWSKECLLHWSQFFAFAWFGTVMICFEWWIYEFGLIYSGYLGQTELASQSITMQISTSCWVPFLGLSMAASIRIGHMLGANDPEGALNSCRVFISITWCLSALISFLIFTLRNVIPMMFTDKPEVISMASSGLSWYALPCLFEGTFLVCGGIMRGAGQQNIGALITCASYAVGLLVAVPLMISTPTITAFWQGISVGIALEAVLLFAICIRTDWEKQALRALGSVTIATDNYEVIPNDTKDSPSDKDPLLGEKQQQVTTWTYVRTVLAALLVLGVLAVSTLVRIYVPTKESTFGAHNITIVYNGTHF